VHPLIQFHVVLSSGTSGRYVAWIGRFFFAFEAAACTAPRPPQDYGDRRIQLYKELGWANMLHCQERSLTRVP
jgi:hypothetical protein